MTNKIQAIWSAALSGIFGFIAWLATVPPEQQSGILGSITNLFSIEWQPTIALWTSTFAKILAFWSLYKAAHSGPKSPPVDTPPEVGDQTAQIDDNNNAPIRARSTVRPGRDTLRK